ncbi:MAG TPA: peptidoglycan-binding protein, partial [Chitinophagaceae bacterium]
MKYLVLATILFYSLVSCDSLNKEEKPEIEKKISKRDYSITKENSYSDLFLDSMAMEKFITDNQLNDSITRRMRSFYNTRNYQFAWFTSNGLTEQARGFWNIHDYQTTYKKDSSLIDKKLQKRMDNLITEESLTVSDKNKTDIETELKLTQHFITYILNSFEEGFVKRKEMERFVPRKKEDVLALADSLVNKKHKDDKYYDDVNRPYRLLKMQLGHYLNIARQGGWQPISTDKKSFKKGASAPEIAAIKRRLFLTRDLPVNDTSQVYNDTLEIAVKTFQQRFGFKPDGIIDAAMIKQLNVPVEKRVEQLYMNLERMRWMWS